MFDRFSDLLGGSCLCPLDYRAGQKRRDAVVFRSFTQKTSTESSADGNQRETLVLANKHPQTIAKLHFLDLVYFLRSCRSCRGLTLSDWVKRCDRQPILLEILCRYATHISRGDSLNGFEVPPPLLGIARHQPAVAIVGSPSTHGAECVVVTGKHPFFRLGEFCVRDALSGNAVHLGKNLLFRSIALGWIGNRPDVNQSLGWSQGVESSPDLVDEALLLTHFGVEDRAGSGTEHGGEHIDSRRIRTRGTRSTPGNVYPAQISREEIAPFLFP